MKAVTVAACSPTTISHRYDVRCLAPPVTVSTSNDGSKSSAFMQSAVSAVKFGPDVDFAFSFRPFPPPRPAVAAFPLLPDDPCRVNPFTFLARFFRFGIGTSESFEVNAAARSRSGAAAQSIK